MSTELIIQINLGNVSQSQAELPVPIHKVRVGGVVGINDALVDGEFTITDLSGVNK